MNINFTKIDEKDKIYMGNYMNFTDSELEFSGVTMYSLGSKVSMASNVWVDDYKYVRTFLV